MKLSVQVTVYPEDDSEGAAVVREVFALDRDTWRTAMHDVSDKAAAQFRARWAGRSDGPPDPDTVAEIFTWMFERSCHQILRNPTRQAELAESMVEIIWRVLDYRI